MKKRGLAKPVAVLLIILIAIIAIGLIWFFLQGFFREQGEISEAKQRLLLENVQIDEISLDENSQITLTLSQGAQERILVDVEVIENFGDIVFVVDSSDGMFSEFESLKRTVSTFTTKLQEAEVNVKLSLIEFRDYFNENWPDPRGCQSPKGGGSCERFVTRVHEFPSGSGEKLTGEIEKFENTLNNIRRTCGGGDLPNAHLAGLDSALNLPYTKDADKFIILISDAPPHAEDCSCSTGDNCVTHPSGEKNTYDLDCDYEDYPISVFDVEKDLVEEGIMVFYINKDDPNAQEYNLFNTDGLCANRVVADDLTSATGGMFFNYNEAEGIDEIIEDLLVTEIIKHYADRIDHLKVIFYSDTESAEQQISSADLPGPLGKKTYTFELEPPIDNVNRVEIYSVIVTSSGKQIIGPPMDIVSVEGLG